MNKEIKNILNDLYSLDQSFKKFEPELLKIINELTMTKPEVLIDETFKQELKTKLIKRAQELNQQTTKKFKFNFMSKKLYYLAGAVILLILLIIPAYNYLNPGPSGVATIEFGQSIEPLGANAFGQLAVADAQNQEALGLGGGGGVPAPTVKTESSTTFDSIRTQSGGGGGYALPAPDWTAYKFVYRGEDLTNLPKTMLVYKKLRGLVGNPNFSAFLSQFNFNDLDLSQLAQAQIQSINLAEDKPFGLTAHLNFDEGSIALSANYYKWPNVYEDCRDQACYEKNTLNIEQVPSDQELIKLANQFVAKYRINLSDYGEPYVNTLWKDQQDYVGENQSYAYIPEEIQVVYPEMINGQYIYDSSGNKQGINVGINIRHKKVSSLYNLTSRNFQSSSYQTVDFDQILASAEQGGLNRTYWPKATNVIEIDQGTPELALIKTWQYQTNQDYPDEIITPAYIFPIINWTEGFDYWRKNVVVPLIQDLLTEDIIRPIPLLEQSATAPKPAILEDTETETE